MHTENAKRMGRSCALVLLSLLLLSLSVGAREQSALAGQVVRLHVLANSDEAEDQALKLRVRDVILEQAEPLLQGAANQQQARTILEAHLPQLASAGERAVREAGFDYPVRAELTKASFPTRRYEDFALPAGVYPALRIVIGAGQGHNWWCVVYPPLCSEGIEEVEETALALTPDQVRLITEDTPDYQLRFRCAELWGSLMNHLQEW